MDGKPYHGERGHRGRGAADHAVRHHLRLDLPGTGGGRCSIAADHTVAERAPPPMPCPGVEDAHEPGDEERETVRPGYAERLEDQPEGPPRRPRREDADLAIRGDPIDRLLRVIGREQVAGKSNVSPKAPCKSGEFRKRCQRRQGELEDGRVIIDDSDRPDVSKARPTGPLRPEEASAKMLNRRRRDLV